MSNFVPSDRSQGFLLPLDMREWLPDDDLAHFVIAAADRIEISAFKVNERGTGKRQYHPRMMVALLVYCYANGIFSSRKVERATFRDIGVRVVAANAHPDHDTIAAFRRENETAFAAAFLEVLTMAKEIGLLTVGTVAIDGTKIEANASKVRSVRYDRAQELRVKLQADIAALIARAKAEDDKGDQDDQALPEEIARRAALLEKLDAACARIEADARREAEAARPAFEARKAAFDARGGPGRPPVPPDDTPAPTRYSNLTDPDSALMRRSRAHEFRQAYNAQAAVDADGTQLILSTNVARVPSDQPTFAATILAMEDGVGLPTRVLADAGFADEEAVREIEEKDIEALVAGRLHAGPARIRLPPRAA
jgi:transposase